MHLLLGFVGSIGTLMANTGLEEIMKSVFGGVAKVLTGKKFPENCRALRMVTQELLRDILQPYDCHTDMMVLLEEIAPRSRTVELWLDNLVMPTLILMLFVRAEREADWPLHLWSVKQMIPYFFAAVHINYARKNRIRADNEDRAKLRARIKIAIDPLDPHDHPAGIINIVTGRIATDNVTVDQSVTIRQQQV
ncbi:hypothetical protein LSH36_713g01032 [Paralvinella palmiformis]|uniref:Uncharacterized protein n=1 Tax=Paralvinella palmiformis TaxID=53620 RepID=A0AAD9J2N9_9ANNE|nr:hypothetical protein LSH36_713g01032 [Paralvinella palmiformis]